MYDYDPPKNVNEYLHDVDIDVDMDVCLMYYEQLEDQAEQYTDPVHDTDANWKIVRMDQFDVADDVMQQLGLKDFVKDYRPRFYLLEKNSYLMNHIDHGTQCSINIIISEDDITPAPVIFEGGELHQKPEGGQALFYTSSLFNTTKMHGVINDEEDRILLKISIFDKTFEQCREAIQKAKNETHYYNKLGGEPEYEAFRNLFDGQATIGTQRYKELHTDLLQPTNIKIDLDLFKEEIKSVEFEQWGNTVMRPYRYGMALTKPEQDIDSFPNPANWPMDTWNINHPDIPLVDTMFTEPTDDFKNMQSLRPILDAWQEYLARSNILLWNTGSRFLPHVDVMPPFHNLRLWGTNDPDNYHFMFWNPRKGKYIRAEGLEAGRIYLADTSHWHHAYSTADDNYTFFIALQVSAYDTIKECLI